MKLETYTVEFHLLEDIPDDKWDDLYIALEDLFLQDTIESFIEQSLEDNNLTDITVKVR